MKYKKVYYLVFILCFFNIRVFAKDLLTAQSNINTHGIDNKNNSPINNSIKKITSNYKRNGYVVDLKKIYLKNREKKHLPILYLKNEKYGTEFSFILKDSKENLKEDKRFKICFFAPSLDDCGSFHALEHLIAADLLEVFEKQYGGEFVSLSYGAAPKYPVLATTHKNFLDLNFNSKYFDENGLKVIFKTLLDPVFLRDGGKIFKEEVHDSFKGEPIGRVYIEEKNREEVADIISGYTKYNTERHYQQGGNSKEILNLDLKILEGKYKEFINPYNMLFVGPCFDDEKEINRFLDIFEKEYLERFKVDETKRNKQFLRIPLKDKTKFKLVDLPRKDLIFKSFNTKSPKTADSEFLNYASTFLYNLTELDFNLIEKLVLELFTREEICDIFQQQFKNKGYEKVDIMYDMAQDIFSIIVSSNKKELFEEEILKKNIKEVFENIIEKDFEKIKARINSFYNNNSYLPCFFRDLENSIENILAENRYTYGDIFPEKGIFPFLYEHEASNEDILNIIYNNLKNVLCKLAEKEPLIDCFHRNLNNKGKYQGYYNIPIKFELDNKNRSLLFILEDLLIRKLEKKIKNLHYNPIRKSEFCGGYLKGEENVASQKTLYRYLNEDNRFYDFVRNIEINQKDFEEARDTFVYYLKNLDDRIKETNKMFQEQLDNLTNLTETTLNSNMFVDVESLEKACDIMQKFIYLDSYFASILVDLKPKTKEEFMKYFHLNRDKSDFIKEVMNMRDMLFSIRDKKGDISVFASNYKKFNDISFEGITILKEMLDLAKGRDVMSYICSAKLDSFEQANPNNSNIQYFEEE